MTTTPSSVLTQTRPVASISSAGISKDFAEHAQKPGAVARKDGDAAASLASAAKKIEAVLKAALPADRVDHAFLCGPGDLIESSRSVLLRLGVLPERIHVEHFTVDGRPAPALAPIRAERRAEAETPAAIVEIRLNGLDHVVPLQLGETIVEAGLRQGLEMPYSCRGGMCCTCRAKLVSGEVQMDHNFSLEPWEMAAGYVLTCQSHPLTPKVAVDYDHV